MGIGVTQSDSLAVEWLGKAAAQGHAPAQVYLGWAYAVGRGVPKDEARAISLYRSAADQGDPTAQNRLGEMYENGRGVAKDERVALEWFRKSAEQGFPPAQVILGRMYDGGHGVAKNQALAIEWYEKGVASGDPEAQNALAYLLTERSGASASDIARAVELARASYAKRKQYFIADTLGWALVRNGQAEDAIEPLRSAVDEPGKYNAICGYHLAVALACTGKAAEATAELDRALKTDRSYEGRAAAERAVKEGAQSELCRPPAH
jgi:TPR repeat protein